jgi:hypothetical protein
MTILFLGLVYYNNMDSNNLANKIPPVLIGNSFCVHVGDTGGVDPKTRTYKFAGANFINCSIDFDFFTSMSVFFYLRLNREQDGVRNISFIVTVRSFHQMLVLLSFKSQGASPLSSITLNGRNLQLLAPGAVSGSNISLLDMGITNYVE